jgi:hypothetical protein
MERYHDCYNDGTKEVIAGQAYTSQMPNNRCSPYQRTRFQSRKDVNKDDGCIRGDKPVLRLNSN